MSDRIHVATRKGLMTVDRGASGWRVAETTFLGEPVTAVLHDPRDGALYAALNLGHFGVKLHRADDGATFEEVGLPAYPVADGEGDPPSLKQIWILEHGGADRPGALWAGTIPGGLFESEDRGASWTLNRALWERPERENWFGGGYDDPGIHSIAVDPEQSRRLFVGVSCGGAWVSEDGGDSWENRTRGMFAEYMPPERREDPSIQDPHRLVQCRSRRDSLWVQHHNGVFRSTDAGRQWEEIPNVPPTVAGFAVAVHPDDDGTVWFVPMVKDECRIPRDGKLVVARTRDGGRSFETLTDGLPQEHAYHLVFRHAFDLDADGRRLAMGSTTGGLWISEDQGDHWIEVSAHLPPIYAVRFSEA